MADALPQVPAWFSAHLFLADYCSVRVLRWDSLCFPCHLLYSRDRSTGVKLFGYISCNQTEQHQPLYNAKRWSYHFTWAWDNWEQSTPAHRWQCRGTEAPEDGPSSNATVSHSSMACKATQGTRYGWTLPDHTPWTGYSSYRTMASQGGLWLVHASEYGCQNGICFGRGTGPLHWDGK
jgi:hypothetical protein